MEDAKTKAEDIADPLTTVAQHEDRIELLERQVAALMRLADSRLQTATGVQNVSHMWPTAKDGN